MKCHENIFLERNRPGGNEVIEGMQKWISRGVLWIGDEIWSALNAAEKFHEHEVR
jgi:hypothetical protein